MGPRENSVHVCAILCIFLNYALKTFDEPFLTHWIFQHALGCLKMGFLHFLSIIEYYFTDNLLY